MVSDTRTVKAIKLVETGAIKATVDEDGRKYWDVMGSKIWTVTETDEGQLQCNCPDSIYHGPYCKHVRSVEIYEEHLSEAEVEERW